MITHFFVNVGWLLSTLKGLNITMIWQYIFFKLQYSLHCFSHLLCEMQNVQLAKAALRPGAGNMVNGILRKLVVLKVYFLHMTYPLTAWAWYYKEFLKLSIKINKFSSSLMSCLQENETLPLPKVEGDDRSQARALATLYSHPVVSVYLLLLFLHHC